MRSKRLIVFFALMLGSFSSLEGLFANSSYPTTQPYSDPNDSHRLDSYYQLLNQRPITENFSKVKAPVSVPDDDKKTGRTHQEGILDVEASTISPLQVNVSAGLAQVVGNMDLTTRRETTARWVFEAENIPNDQNIWDSEGRAILVPGKVTCHVTYRASLVDYQKNGLTLTAGGTIAGVGASYSQNFSREKVRSDFFEDSNFCELGDVPALITQGEIEQKCKKCLGNVLKTLKQDAESRLARLNFIINAPVCTKDTECYREDSDWYAGRCVLTKDKNESYFSECRARGSIGAACPGEGSRGLFEYKCDKGLSCIKIHSSTSWGDFNKYECRDPFNLKFKGPLSVQNRPAYWTAKSDLERIKKALEKFYQTHKRYPTTEEGIKALADGKAIPRDPFSPFGKGYLYVSTDGDSYIATSVGPDHKVSTRDDILIRK